MVIKRRSPIMDADNRSRRRVLQGMLGLLLPAILAGAATAAEGSRPAFPFSFLPAAKDAATANAAADGPRFRILNGDIAADGAWPWQVALVSRGDDTVLNRQYCGGTLVTRSWVLTAAHCVFDTGEDGLAVPILPESLDILVGTNLLIAGQGELIPVAHIYSHPDYDPVAIEHDIALIALARPPGSPELMPVQLPTKEIEPQIAAVGTTATTIGWGMLDTGDYPIDLRQVQIQILDTAECNREMIETLAAEAKSYFDDVKTYLGTDDDVAATAWKMMLHAAEKPVTDNMVCSGTAGAAKGSCSGDSGGPLMIALPNGSYVQVGIVSWSLSSADNASCDLDGKFSVYTRVANYAGWIASVILAEPSPPMAPMANAPNAAPGNGPAVMPTEAAPGAAIPRP